ncbi:hypothetical protein LTR62_004331 [Meristemomyces frigidus]|uniref:Uncharacterized protein n=1 Tax=Meristemomyces frigidus TaxID=1508187 RepID=A0AAN7YP97_9PEZI|nr:hypothetical protein LTR62_004331 [Meristemomyces frigidus]
MKDYRVLFHGEGIWKLNELLADDIKSVACHADNEPCPNIDCIKDEECEGDHTDTEPCDRSTHAELRPLRGPMLRMGFDKPIHVHLELNNYTAFCRVVEREERDYRDYHGQTSREESGRTHKSPAGKSKETAESKAAIEENMNAVHERIEQLTGHGVVVDKGKGKATVETSPVVASGNEADRAEKRQMTALLERFRTLAAVEQGDIEVLKERAKEQLARGVEYLEEAIELQPPSSLAKETRDDHKDSVSPVAGQMREIEAAAGLVQSVHPEERAKAEAFLAHSKGLEEDISCVRKLLAKV